MRPLRGGLPPPPARRSRRFAATAFELPRLHYHWCSPCFTLPSPHISSRASAGRSKRGLASGSGLARSGSLGASMSGASLSSLGGASSGGCGAAVAGRSGGQEVCSPPPSKPLRFLAPPPEVPSSPFASAAAAITPLPPADRQQQLAAGGSTPAAPPPRRRQQQQQAQQQQAQAQRQQWDDDGMGSDGGLDDQENQQPCPAASPAATWLSPAAARPRAKAAAATAPMPIPGPTAGLLSPGALPTPAKAAGGAAGSPGERERPLAGLVHAPSFSSWMVDAARPPSPPPSPDRAPGGSGAGVDVSDVVAGLAPGAARAARAFGTPGGAPSHLDRILAALGDTCFPASRECAEGWLAPAAAVAAGVGSTRGGSTRAHRGLRRAARQGALLAPRAPAAHHPSAATAAIPSPACRSGAVGARGAARFRPGACLKPPRAHTVTNSSSTRNSSTSTRALPAAPGVGCAQRRPRLACQQRAGAASDPRSTADSGTSSVDRPSSRPALFPSCSQLGSTALASAGLNTLSVFLLPQTAPPAPPAGPPLLRLA